MAAFQAAFFVSAWRGSVERGRAIGRRPILLFKGIGNDRSERLFSLNARIDRHTWQLLKGVGLSTLLGVGTELGWGSSESDLVRAVRESAQQNGARAGDQLVARSLDVQPTLKVRPGWPLRIIVHKDIVLRPWRAEDS